ncbi:hypothetical protein M8C21_000056, partial [Ambrosia artemisiifolia]
IYCLSFLYKTTNTPPEASGAWPIIGHLKVFSGHDLPHVTLSSMADRYGPIFMIRLGIRKVLVVSNWEITKEIFTTHDVIVSDRPDYKAAKILGFNGANFSFTPYGPYWRGLRKIISQELLSNSRLEKLRVVRVIELESAIKNMHDLWREKRDEQGKVLVEMKKWFGELNMNTMLKVVVGKRYTGGADSEDEEEIISCRGVIREWFEYLGQFLVSDALPFLDWLDLGGYKKTMKRVAKELDSIFGKWLEEHRKKRSSGNATNVKDFIDVMMDVVEDDKVAGYDAVTIIKTTCQTLIAGGADTSSIMLTWALSLLLNNRHALRKVQEELDTQVGKDRQVNESDIKDMVYLQAVVKETLRLYPAGFLGGPRAFTKACTIAGYHVQEGTWLLTNIWKIHLIYCLSFLYKTTNTPPEASGAWPIIGHLKVFSGHDLPHVTLSSMADRFGPIFMIRLGIRNVLVVSNWEITKEIFTTHDVIVSDRPEYKAAKILGFNGANFSFTPYGPYWCGLRKIISQELLSNSRLEKLRVVRVIELESAIKNMHDLWRGKRDGQGKVLVEMKK